MQAGAEPIHTTVAAVLAWSMNVTVPPLAIVTDFVGFAIDADPSVVQHDQVLTSQFSLISSFASDGAAASAGSTATDAPSSAARAKSTSTRGLESVRGLIVRPRFA
jgi:hypothetical protein